MNAVVIGCGQIGCLYSFDKKRKYISSYAELFAKQKSFQLLSIVDTDSKKKKYALKFAKHFHTHISSLKKLPAIDIAAVAVSEKAHYTTLKYLIQTLNVPRIIAEKPFCLNVKHAHEILRLAKKHNVKIIINTFRRFDDLHTKIYHEYILKKPLGKALTGTFYYSKEFSNSGYHLIDLLLWWFKDLKVQFSSKGSKPHVILITPQKTLTIHLVPITSDNYFEFTFDLYFEKGKITFNNIGFECYIFKPKPFKYAHHYTTLHCTNHKTSSFNYLQQLLKTILNKKTSTVYPDPIPTQKLMKAIQNA